MPTKVTGKQIKDDTITGDDVDESTLVLPQMYHSSADHNNDGIMYISMPGRNSWSNVFNKRQHQMLAPFDGKVTSFMLRPTNGDASNTAVVQFRYNSTNNTIQNGQPNAQFKEKTNLTFGISEGTHTVDVSSDDWSISKGNVFGFSIVRGSGHPNYGKCNFVAVIEWDLSS